MAVKNQQPARPVSGVPEFALDAALVGALVCLGVAIGKLVGAWAVWAYLGLCLLLVAYTFANSKADDE